MSNYSQTERLEIAQTILNQLGGGQFQLMCGVKQIALTDCGVSFRIGGGAKNGINYVQIDLTPADLYDVAFWKLGRKTMVQVSKLDGIYADQLRELFTEKTGFYCTFRG